LSGSAQKKKLRRYVDQPFLRKLELAKAFTGWAFSKRGHVVAVFVSQSGRFVA
jgi:hypothetical protein